MVDGPGALAKGGAAAMGMMSLLLYASLAGAAPLATAAEHTIVAKVDSNGRLSTKTTWVVRLDSSAACTAGLRAPSGLDGAQSEGAAVTEGQLFCVPGTPVGTVLSFENTVKQRKGPFDRFFFASPDIPTERTVVDVLAPTWMALAVWQDDARVIEYTTRRGYGVKYTWLLRDGREPVRAAFSTYKTWVDASRPIESAIKYKISRSRDLRSLGDLQYKSVGQVTAAVYAALPLDPAAHHAWTDRSLRRARDILSSPGAGVSPTERALVLVSALRAAGHDADVALFDPDPSRDAVALNLVSPSRYSEPAVAVTTPSRTIWIDPTAAYAPVPDPARSMAGRPAWRVGDAPVRVPASRIDGGEVSIDGTVTLGLVANQVDLTISGTGTTREMLRELLAPLSDAGRAGRLSALAGAGRLGNVTVQAEGLDGIGPDLQIHLTGVMKSELVPMGDGLAGPFTPVLAPGFAKAFNAEIRVREALTVVPPEGTTFFANSPAPPAIEEGAMISRQLAGTPEEAQLLMVIERLSAEADPALDALFDEQTLVGPTLMFLGPTSGKTVRSFKKTVTGVERTVLQSALWHRADNTKKGDRLLKRARRRASAPEVAGYLEQYTLTGDIRAWISLMQTLKTEQDKLAVLAAMERKQCRREAWQYALHLTHSDETEIRRQAYLAILRLQGDRPDAAVDREAHDAWIKPKTLIKAARKEAAELGVLEPELFALAAEDLIIRNRLMEARSTLESAEEEGMTNTMVAVLSAELDAMEGAVVADVVDNVAETAALEPMNPDIWRHSARIMNRIGQQDLAMEYAARAARLAFDEPHRWLELADYALAAGDLETALQAARHASDQHPDHRLSGIRLKLTALFAGDLELSNLGAERGGQGAEFAVPSLQVLFDQAGHEAALALLVHHDGAVTASRELLTTRAHYLLDAGRYEEAARDGHLLAGRHRHKDGIGYLFAANAGSFWVAPYSLRALNSAVSRSKLARRVRMEWALISGSSDPRSDAYSLRRSDPKAQLVVDSRSRPDEVAMRITGWSATGPDPRVKAPREWRRNTTLRGPTGVTALSDKVAGESMLFLEPSLGLLPGPTGVMFRQPERPVRTLLSGANLYRLEDSRLPIFAAVLFRDVGDLIGLGTTEAAAEHAVMAAEGFAPVEE